MNKDIQYRLGFDSRLISKMNSRINESNNNEFMNNSSPYLTEVNYDHSNNNKLPLLNNSDYK
jgi:hypothetical protein